MYIYIYIYIYTYIYIYIPFNFYIDGWMSLEMHGVPSGRRTNIAHDNDVSGLFLFAQDGGVTDIQFRDNRVE